MANAKKGKAGVGKGAHGAGAPAPPRGTGKPHPPQTGSKAKPASAKTGPEQEVKRMPATAKTSHPATARSAAARSAAAPSQRPDLSRLLADAREQIRLLLDDRDNHVAMAEAAEMERESLERDLVTARERIGALEKQLAEGSGSGASPAAEGEERSIGFDEEEEEEEERAATDDLDDVEAIYDRMDDPRVRRQELDRERIDRESEAGDETYWRVCPKCGDSLEEVESEDVKIDRCESCGGIYLDHGEVEMLLSIARGPQGLRRVRSALQI